VPGATSITSAAVTLTNAYNQFGSVAVSAYGQSVSVRDAGALELAATIAGSLTAYAGGSITQSGTPTVSEASSFTATGGGDIALANAANDFNSVTLTASSGYGGGQSVRRQFAHPGFRTAAE